MEAGQKPFALIQRMTSRENPLNEGVAAGGTAKFNAVNIRYLIVTTANATIRVLECGTSIPALWPNVSGYETVGIDDISLARLRQGFGLKKRIKATLKRNSLRS